MIIDYVLQPGIQIAFIIGIVGSIVIKLTNYKINKNYKLGLNIPSSTLYNVNEFKEFCISNKKRFNLIINIFYPSSQLSEINNYHNFFDLSVNNLSSVLDKINHKHINKIIYTSSSSVYGSINDHNYLNESNLLVDIVNSWLKSL